MNSAIYLNSANEVAVDAFLKRKIKFTTITHIVSEILEKANFHEPESIADVKDTDVEARAMAYQSLKKWNSR
jgi:1-deoxy-D-xylulose-5-phosphate reductoisomerase